ncbi:SDR family oxidoreductase [Francisella orientalis]|uniref:3-ketoacyl-(Acyl-carrier-protein) reductase n=2 Tax=Francisella orientalis TaxID=299583 RepID=A0AAP6X9J2_9GAMM|nr:SDR family oxidoreductase [Francisella orientalis]AHB98773.1 3-ketoacyl-ACP reductase [Francisella orientalis LADL 07-285A]AKN87574.1 3-ketoacyl-(Acyl-carrier-protein) reductase [Francisella orientalis FNO24]AFJ43297.1 3-ketoacyl-(acyl-carrier-protein) reductase [Francisella orientalis str. Toba 04]AKN86036.1 3-ketoacyl-(Acyl-carrier-protein) reductase [Francisella orientalis FNO12]AKN89112.1 3-ketoacyl-(Acyl-carrier-protein) reductase [Francisella orientalis]
MELANKVAIVTGGANGLGKAIVEMLLSNNTIVCVLDISKEALESLVKNKNLFKIPCDITKENQISNTIQEIKKQFSKIDILVNNAGILYSEPLINIMSKEKRHSVLMWQKVIDINLTAPFVLGSYVVEQMIMTRTKGVIINISSISARGNAGQSAYSAAKAGLESMTAVWAKELGSFGIRCIAVAPGFMNTESTNCAVTQEILDHVRKETPIKRLGKAKDIAEAVKFVIQSDYMNGKTLQIDGGLVF